MRLLAIDAGGTTSRALLLDEARTIHGHGVSTSGNATSVGVEAALDGIAAAAAQASGGHTDDVDRVVLAAAGEQRLLPIEAVRDALGLDAGVPVRRIEDVLAMYHSGAVEDEGVALVAGTGAIAARFASGRAVALVDGTGWLLGDRGSGFWIGRRVVRAVAEEFDGTGRTTMLTPLVFAHYDLSSSGQVAAGRNPVLQRLVGQVYAAPPAALARLAPLALEAAAAGDRVAAEILDAAEAALAETLRQVRRGAEDLPVVVGGGLLVGGLLERLDRSGPALGGELDGADVRVAGDGVVGAALVCLRDASYDVDREDLAALTAQYAAVSSRS